MNATGQVFVQLELYTELSQAIQNQQSLGHRGSFPQSNPLSRSSQSDLARPARLTLSWPFRVALEKSAVVFAGDSAGDSESHGVSDIRPRFAR